jgi:hypothetical protein
MKGLRYKLLSELTIAVLVLGLSPLLIATRLLRYAMIGSVLVGCFAVAVRKAAVSFFKAVLTQSMSSKLQSLVLSVTSCENVLQSTNLKQSFERSVVQ